MANEKFFLIFSEQPLQRVQINEPINFGEVDFNLDQKEGGMGRDVSLSGGKVSFRFTRDRHDVEFTQILYYAHYYGFEADIKLIIVLENNQEFIGELDFATSKTNDYDYFECSVILESALQLFKRRSETKVDLFSSVDINGNQITPLSPLNILLQAKPSIQISRWEKVNKEDFTIFSAFLIKAFNPAQNLIRSDIEDSYTFFEVDKFVNGVSGGIEPFKILLAQSSLKNVNILIKNVKVSVPAGSNLLRLFVCINNTPVRLMDITGGGNLQQDFNYNIPQLSRGETVSLFWIVQGSAILNLDYFEVKAESTAYNSIAPTFRLIDVMKQVALSNSGLKINAPRYENGGQFYDTVLTSGKLLGGNITDPFYISWDDIEKSIKPEHNADSEIQIDGRIFVGIEEDFFTNNECGFFNETQFSGMSRKPNPIYCLNEFKFKYNKYQALKENTEPNSDSTIHGESILTPYNQKVENSKENAVQWVRDAILLDVQQRLSTKVSKDTATQDDDTIFAIDTIPTSEDKQFTETTSLQHTYVAMPVPFRPILSLRSNGDVNFLVLGIRENAGFKILLPDPNYGDYTVVSITNSEVQLVRSDSGSLSASNDGIRLTKYTYEIKQSTIPLTNRTNEGFEAVINLISPDKYSNLRYSVERNIRNYWNKFLATVNLYHKDRFVRNTFYKNNGRCETEYSGLRVIEKEDFIPTDPIVTPYMYEDVILANLDFADFIDLQQQIRVKRGFIRTIDNNNRVLKLYPIKMSYENSSRQLTISGQEKFQKSYLSIVKKNGIITINDETKIRNLIYDEIALERDKQVILFDLQRQRLYNPIFWDKVSVNGAIPESINILKEWLDLLK